MRLAPAELKAFLIARTDTGEPITAGQRIALRTHLQDVCGSKENRYKFTRWIWGVESSADLWPAHWQRIRLWLDPRAIAGTEPVQWAVRAECYDDAREVIRLQAAAEYDAKIAAGQMPLLPGL